MKHIKRKSLNGIFPGTTWVSSTRRQNHSGFNEARDDGLSVASAKSYANHLHTIHASNSSLNFLQVGCSFLMPNQQCHLKH